MTVLRPWDAPEITSWGRLPMHSLAHRSDAPGLARLELDGTWRFELFATPEEALALPATTPPRASLPVPACWTVEPFDDVHGVQDLPKANPTGVYEVDVEVPADWAGRRVVLHVGAAESVLIVQVDGVDVGISKDSHLSAEFDVTDVVRPGQGCVLRLIVVKWSDASLVEGRDRSWRGGLTRSVFLYATARVHLADVRVVAGLGPDRRTGRLELRVDVAAASSITLGADELGPGWSVQARLEGAATPLGPAAVPASPPVDRPAAGSVQGAAGPRRRPPAPGRVALTGEVPQVVPWSPETPRLYRIDVRLHGPDGALVEGTTVRVGFRDVRIEGNDLLVNGARFLIRGVIRHDTDPLRGRAVTADAIREDLLMVKRFGFNALRTAHHPNDPVLLDLADEFGLLVVAEADLHAFADTLCEDPAYLPAFVDRVSRMVRRDKNHPSVVAWSLGDASGYGCNHDAAAGWVRRYDPTRPLHHEGAIASDWSSPQTASDLTCPMYPPIDSIVAHARSGWQRHPLIMSEYSHAMGNSNGSLADYWHAIESTPGLQGGFVRELHDQALLKRLGDPRPAGAAALAEGRGGGWAPGGHRWAHAGDFGAEPNDGAFIADGLAFPDRTPKPAMWEHRQLAAPVALSPGRQWGEVVVANRQHVRDLGWVRGQWQVFADGGVRRPAVARLAPADLPPVPPGGRATVQLPQDLLAGLGNVSGEAWLTLRLISGIDEPWAPAGTPVPGGQLLLRPETRPLLLRAGAALAGPYEQPASAPVQLDEEALLVHPDLVAPPRLALWRAPTDNDRLGGMEARWRALGLDRVTRTVTGVDRDGPRTVVRAVYVTGGGIDVEHTQVITPIPFGGDGPLTALLVEESARIPPELADLPRVGTVFEVDGALAWADWFGAGPWETYPDRRACGEIGGFGAHVDFWFVPYLRPQESGGRHGVRWFCLSDTGPDGRAATRGVAVHLDQPRQVSLSRFRAEDLEAATHPDELAPRPVVVVHLDAAHRGLGTASCGPDTLPAYRLGPGLYQWSWVLAPHPFSP